MADDHSFDIVSKVDLTEVENAVNQALKEILARFDFKGTKTRIELEKAKNELVILSDDEYKLKNVIDVLKNWLAKRKVPLMALQFEKVEQALAGTVRQTVKLQQGIAMEKAKEIVKAVKDSKMKVQSEIQKDQVRVRGKKIDDLRAVMDMLNAKDFGIHMEFVNYR
ncbi:MAG: YajQ family cyclic di-GMP-binding protein [Nitrospirae bacterium]|nr:YajQ family cyclic di-GMP-binding protein [Nitrospirota bacterium]